MSDGRRDPPERREISPLDDRTVREIAAGEVVERPASVVKELVENALDAGASRVAVAVEAGGVEGVRVRDDGHGMRPDQLPDAVARHATSKLDDTADLDAGVGTLGFRGEALHTVGAVAELTLRSRPPDAETGAELTVAHGETGDVRRVGCPAGTTVVVRDLFGETPARRKFLKTPATEFDRVNATVSAYALANPDVAVSLEHDGREVFASTGDGDLRSAVLAVYGREVAEAMVPVGGADPVESGADAESGAGGEAESEVRVSGLVSHPETTRAGREYLTTFVNGRWVRDGALRSAVVSAYGGQLASDRYPFATLFVDVPPAAVDVNVHPRKTEVRFDDDAGVTDRVETAVREALLDHGLVRSSAPRGRSAPDETAVDPEVVGGAGTDHERAAEARREPPSAGGDGGTDGDGGGGGDDGGGDDGATTSVLDAWSGSAASDPGGPSGSGGPGRPGESSGSDGPSDPSGSRGSDESAGSDGADGSAGVTAETAGAADAAGGSDGDGAGGRPTDHPPRGGGAGGWNGRPSPRGWQAGDDSDGNDGEGGEQGDGGEGGHGEGGERWSAPAQSTLAGGTTDERTDHESLPAMRVLGQYDGTYLVCETDAGLVLVDQHAADERVNYERLREAVGREAPVQTLAEPVELELTAREDALFDSFEAALADAGFRAERSGDRSVAVTAVPAVFDATLDPDLLRDVLAALADDVAAGDRPVAEVVDALLADLACYPSVTGNTALTAGSVTDLLDALDACENPYACPHGRPVLVEFGREEVEARFERDYPGHAGRRERE
ncbi:DNA mismatch repair endonuclease MutL [Candidatus Halobonum tyrrellensis]|uniref:DNA mismatch repair protein MutL n=1 Tax=Candidatus Halobonum tyrrellensis G22 TaxID=1324957 RepID=V4HE73_9EURY|nr:DNA mismatch repair endonuclease MutL [Candidatus Halobonum tyrrellensis]ESP88975.1 DNA mismatch repair protein MutL [Candidatus Halobonum tyrrellensis G22]